MKTAVEFLENQYNSNGKLTPVDFYQAKEMEKQQACDFAVGFMMQDRPVVSYWNEQFKKK
jgi:hypothetical protein